MGKLRIPNERLHKQMVLLRLKVSKCIDNSYSKFYVIEGRRSVNHTGPERICDLSDKELDRQIEELVGWV